MGEVQFKQSEEGDTTKVSVLGHIDEDADFSAASISGKGQVELDLDGIKAINSCGIREWIKWVNTASGAGKIVYKNCPKVVVDQINMVEGFLPSNGHVESFYVPYYSDDSGNEKNILFTHGKEFDNSGVTNSPEVKDEDGSEMEMDVIEAKYFKFLGR